MKQPKILLITILLIASSLWAQNEFMVKSFTADPSDLAARTNPLKDTNGDACAIIKVSTDLKGLNFDSQQLEYVQENQYDYWLFVSPGTKFLEIMAQGMISLPYNIPIRIESSRVYRMVLTATGPAGLSATENTVQVTFRLNLDKVYISHSGLAPLQTRGRNASFKLPSGQYTFRFSKSGYNDLTRTIALQEDQVVDITLEQGQSTSGLKLPGIVVITSDPAGADVFINDQKVGQTPYTDQLIAGKYNISLQKKYYHTDLRTLDLSEGESITVPLIRLTPKFAHIAITTSPSSAKVTLDNRFIGNSPVERMQVESGNHTIKIEKDLYHTLEKTITLSDGDDEQLNYDLQPAFGKLVIKSVPEEAEVKINGRSVGTTPYRNAQQPSGNYTVTVSKDKWYSTEEIVTVSDGQATEKTIVLSQNFGTLSITAKESDIYLNNNKVGMGSWSRQLAPGNYNLKASRPKHRDATQQVFLRIGDNQDITLAPEPIMASLSILSQPADKTMGSRIFINNEEVPDKTTPAVFPLIIGDYDVTLKHRGFLDMTQSVTLQENDQKKLVFNLQTYAGSMLQQENKWKRNKRLSFVASVLIAGAGYYCNMQGDKFYDDFQAAKSTNVADTAWDDCENMYLYRDVSYSISIAPVVFGLYSWVKQIHYKNQRVGR